MTSDEEIAEAYATGLSMAAVARLLHASELTIHRSLVRQGIPRRSRGYRAPIDEQPIIDAYTAGATVAEVSEQLGLGRARVERVVRAAGVIRQPAPPVRLPVDEIVTRYQAGQGTPEIAEAVGGSPEGVRRVLIRAGIRLRGPGRPSGTSTMAP